MNHADLLVHLYGDKGPAHAAHHSLSSTLHSAWHMVAILFVTSMEEGQCFLSYSQVFAQPPPNTDTDLNFWFSVNIDSAVVDHFHNGYS